MTPTPEQIAAERDTLRRVLAAICANYPQRQQMLPHVQRAMELLSTECQNCGTVTKPPELRRERDKVIEKLEAVRAECERVVSDIGVIRMQKRILSIIDAG